MAKSIRSKVKKRLRTVKRGVVKRELVTPGTSHNDREVSKSAKAAQALSGHLKAENKALTLMISADDKKAWQIVADMM